MRIQRMELHNFRNYELQVLDFSDGINVLIGGNAQGKTNLLEAIYVLALARSHRTSNEKELIKWGQQTAQIRARVVKKVGSVPLELDLGQKGKKARINHLEQAKLSSYIGNLNVILFAPEDLSIVKGSPQVRRRFMDMEFGQMSNRYLTNLTQYRKILKQRNRYLRNLHNHVSKDKVYLDVLSDQLSAYGAEVIFERVSLLKKLEGFAQKVHKEISQGKEELEFQYKSSVPKDRFKSVDVIYQNLRQQYASIQEKEILRSTSLLGPHRDDLKFVINKKEVASFGSQGQQRTTALSMKLAEIDLMKEQTGEYPVLLLDDVLSELDSYRQTHLLLAIQNKVQTFITTTSLSDVQQELLKNPKIFRIDNGKVSVE